MRGAVGAALHPLTVCTAAVPPLLIHLSAMRLQMCACSRGMSDPTQQRLRQVQHILATVVCPTQMLDSPVVDCSMTTAANVEAQQ